MDASHSPQAASHAPGDDPLSKVSNGVLHCQHTAWAAPPELPPWRAVHPPSARLLCHGICWRGVMVVVVAVTAVVAAVVVVMLPWLCHP